ncbi:hypothetical protein Dsin_027646 [Dipteronia sinensis]|uniref:Uncharacterized protein n=1 Tax=Dipteronia sinensis TaxID=43782 RepID=A0AAD9ZP39_9ROSI|nr:hypothetical protein Dsin_027646 [Dipteronia sinensis]
MSWRWTVSSYWWPEFEFSLPSSLFRWPEFDFSYLTATRWSLQRSLTRLLYFTIDELLWSFVTVFESLALVSMLCYFFLFCGCTL